MDIPQYWDNSWAETRDGPRTRDRPITRDGPRQEVDQDEEWTMP